MQISKSLPRLLFSVLITITAPPSLAAENFHYADVVIYGDSPSAVSAAIELADSGHDLLLVSPSKHIGGMMIEGLGNQDIDSRSGSGEPIGGLTAELFLRIGKAYNPSATAPRYSFEPKIAQQVIDAWLTEKNIRQLRDKRISEAPGSVAKTNARITSFLLEDGTRIAGKMFIDGTVEGDLMFHAGVTHTHGREGNAAYGENVGGVLNPTSKDQYNVTVDPYVIPGDPSSGVITGIQNEVVGVHGSADGAAMGFCLRLPLTKNPANKIPITAPPGYDVKDYEIYKRFLAAGGTNDWLDGPGSVNASTTTKLSDLGSWHNLSGNFYGRNHGYPIATHAGREQIYLEHKNYTQGLIHFLSTDPSVPQSIRDEWSRWGLPADEFTDNGGWPRRLYVRCARRMISDYVITEHDVRRNATGTVNPRPPVKDPIGICWWPVDLHNARTVIREGKAYNEGAYFDLGNYKPFGIPYRSIVPKRADCTNLLVPSALSSSYAGYGAVRLEWTFMVLGQSAATAAAIALDDNLAIQDVPYPRLKTLLLSRKQRLTPPAEVETTGIVVDNADPTGVEITGDWSSSTRYPGFNGADYLHDGDTGKGTKSIRFTPGLPTAGRYAVYTRWNSNSPRAGNAPVTITHAAGTADLTLNQQTNGNQWNLLGTWEFSAGTSGSALLTTTGTTGFVIADAFRFVPESIPATPTHLTIAAARALIPENSSTPAKVIIHRTGTTNSPLTVSLRITGTATPGTDYTTLPDSIIIPAGSTTAEISVSPIPDATPEGPETISITLAPDPTHTIDPTPAIITLAEPPYQRWQHQHNLALAPDDPDGDGNKNLLEFVLGGNPNTNDTRETLPEISTLKPNGGPSMDFTYWRKRNLGTTTLAVRTSFDMKGWETSTAPSEILAYDPVTDRLQIRHRFPVRPNTPALFVHLLATGP